MLSLMRFQISAAEKYPNISLKFNKKMTGGRVENGEVSFIECVKFYVENLSN